ncbi:hypothetical protein J2T57_001616 [Natronocella acetinitrilica]|uniref:Uncharacterized protein n=1 Tax=Natronocella acetinitrilica TaxID=414046 RepID=A0AAE3G2N2_9GAMM|nr:hypothetical protein [Natronocella acetinitrilica]MCP1674514.1 hypothetical protein [Natronocella acetinitrilica]
MQREAAQLGDGPCPAHWSAQHCEMALNSLLAEGRRVLRDAGDLPGPRLRLYRGGASADLTLPPARRDGRVRLQLAAARACARAVSCEAAALMLCAWSGESGREREVLFATLEIAGGGVIDQGYRIERDAAGQVTGFGPWSAAIGPCGGSGCAGLLNGPLLALPWGARALSRTLTERAHTLLGSPGRAAAGEKARAQAAQRRATRNSEK